MAEIKQIPKSQSRVQKQDTRVWFSSGDPTLRNEQVLGTVTMKNLQSPCYLSIKKPTIGRSPSLTKLQQGESLERPSEKEEQASYVMQPCMRVDFPRWEEGDPTGWLSHIERYFRYRRTPKASMVDIVVIYLEGDAIQWYNWLEHTKESQRGDNSRAGC
ncbi:hypothetical protein B296_00004171 [Ensete ventricosum]|uniref:Retrotransposon gag domain-containing protein n=1 Tax=Ensete ventricosum TaxID=4639 RepID=A0A427BAI8_ENSVE|nr:hypothetical protein B296_00004171 [Ensete ventricosum]